MQVDIKYAINDIVRFKYPGVVTTTSTCGFCGGTGEISGLDGSKDECPRCDGTGVQKTVARDDLIREEIIRDIFVSWMQGKEPKVRYRMAGWNWSNTEVAEEDIIEKIGEYTPVYPGCDMKSSSEI